MKIILAAHGELATEFHNTLEMIVGDVKHFYPINFYPQDGPEQLRARLEEVIELNSGNEYIVFVDLFGGSPFNVSSALAAEDDNISVITGMNLPMLLELAFLTGETRDTLIEKAMTSAKDGVKLLKLNLDTQEDDDDLEDDEF